FASFLEYIFNMDISLIGTHADAVWNVLHEKGGMDLTQLKQESFLTDK
ncbi:hypothetical protein GKF01_28350, partial [Escherichia coli]|nr:hypothetical protein [Escherichia coli]